MALKELLPGWTDPAYLVDGSSFVHRAFFASPEMSRSDGMATNALFTTLRLFLKLDREEPLRHVIFFMDGKGDNFRHEIYPDYKANRTATPEPLVEQFEPIREAMDILGFKVAVSNGCEADDCIAALAERFKSEHKVVIVGSDKDLRQCLDENVVIWDPQAKGNQLLTLPIFKDITGLDPQQWPDYQALTGDATDNIPGIAGIGPKTASSLLHRFYTLEDILARTDSLDAKESKKIVPFMEQAFLYRRLTTLSTSVCEGIAWGDLVRRPVDLPRLKEFLQRYEFRSLLREYESVFETIDKGASVSGQMSLFLVASNKAKIEPEISASLEKTWFDDAWVAVVVVGAKADASLAFAFAHADSGSWEGSTSHDAMNIRNILYAGNKEPLKDLLINVAMLFSTDVKRLLACCGDLSPASFEKWFDLSLAGYLLNPEERDYSLNRLAASLGLAAEDYNPAELALRVGMLMAPRLKNQGLDDLYRHIEMPLLPVLSKMETKGILLDQTVFAAVLREVRSKMDNLQAQIEQIAGRPFNLRSSRQLSEVLFKDLGLKAADKTPGGEASTSQRVLEKLSGQHQIIGDLLTYRRLEKLRSTYLEPLPKLVDENGRLHTTLNQTATATGRLSSSDPNLQNIPIRGEMGRLIRSGFIAPAGKKLVSADYSQIELRVLAHLSQDPTLLAAFSQGQDIHARTAELLYETTVEQITPDQRRNAKTINFGLLYGMGPQKLAQELKISLKEAKDFIERYFSKLVKLREFYESIELTAKQTGQVTTMAGRRRFLPDIQSANTQLQTAARRQAINTVIQGSAADIIKIAMISVDRDEELAALDAEMILQIHDELLLEVPQQNADTAGRRLAEIMSSIRPGGIELTVPLLVDWGSGNNWAEAH